VATILVLVMGGEAARERELRALGDAGHDLVVLEPRYPENAGELEQRRPALVVVDGVKAPSHGRATASWLATRPGMRTVPFLFLDVPDKDIARVKKELPRAQIATWASLAGAAERLTRK
jgi:hypothetical protein